MGQRYQRFILPVLIVVAFAIWLDLPTNPGLHLGPINRDIQVVRGLDLQGGLRVLLEADLPDTTAITSDQMSTARNIVENRVNGLGVSEPVVQVAGSRRILVELPGVTDPQSAINTLKETGLLEFVELPDQQTALTLTGQTIQTDFGLDNSTQVPATATAGAGTEVATAALTETATTAATETLAPTDTATSEATSGATAGAGSEASPTPTAIPASPTPAAPTVYHTVMTGTALSGAQASRDSTTGEYYVSFQLTSEGSKIFGDYTSSHVGGFLAIVLDKQVISAPRINSAILGGSGQITGSFTQAEANNLAVQLRYGSLPIPLRVAEINSVGPTLGQDSLRKSAIAGIVGLLVVAAFMAFYYRLPGLIADVALLSYAAITFALFKLIPVTLTLPGIAGFVLSIGVAVDANILIFERMKEELRAGRSLVHAIDLGFSRAWPSIRDSNLSTLITCAILFWFGNTFGASIVKGFALTLAIGVLVSLFTAITATRVYLHTVLDNLKLGQHPSWFGV
jgi:preprotein translocase subunit SecD